MGLSRREISRLKTGSQVKLKDGSIVTITDIKKHKSKTRFQKWNNIDKLYHNGMEFKIDDIKYIV